MKQYSLELEGEIKYHLGINFNCCKDMQIFLVFQILHDIFFELDLPTPILHAEEW